MKRTFGDIFWKSTTLNSNVYLEDQQKSQNVNFNRFPEILIRLVNVQQDIVYAENCKAPRVSATIK